jgi:cytochrome c-type biogenesis protein CcmH/NrfG
VYTYRSFVSVRLTLTILAASVIAARGSGQSVDRVDDSTAGFNDARFNAKGVPGLPSSSLSCRDQMADLPICHPGQENADLSPLEVAPSPARSTGMVSADELRHPLSKKAKRSLEKAQSLIQEGKHIDAITQLRELATIPTGESYAYSLLGQEYLRLGHGAAALVELQQAVRLLPNNVPDLANLGLALLMTGDPGGAERALRHALELDPKNLQTKLVLGVTVLEKGSHDEEGVEFLLAAAPRCPSAHVVLAAFYARAGRLDAAEQEARAYLGPASSDPAALHNWVESKARQSATSSGFAFALMR